MFSTRKSLLRIQYNIGHHCSHVWCRDPQDQPGPAVTRATRGAAATRASRGARGSGGWWGAGDYSNNVLMMMMMMVCRGVRGTRGPPGTPGSDGVPGVPGNDGRAGLKGEKGDNVIIQHNIYTQKTVDIYFVISRHFMFNVLYNCIRGGLRD